MSRLLESADRLVEHLLLADRARIVDPLIKTLTRATQVLFRAQRKNIVSYTKAALAKKHEADQKNSTKIPTAVGAALTSAIAVTPTSAWLKAHRITTLAAYNGAAKLVASDLGAEVPTDLGGPLDAVKALNSLEETTFDRLHSALEDLYSKLTADNSSVLSALESEFDDFEFSRAGTVALTELAEAFGTGQSDAARAISLDTGDDVVKVWIAEPDACEICEENADMDPLDIDEPFPSGDDDPPAHPNCRCTLEMRRKDDEDEE